MTDEDRAWLRGQFDRCAPWIQDALDRDLGGFELEDVWDMIADQKAQLWPGPKSAIVTTIDYFPRKIMLRYWLCGGEANDSLDECISATKEIETWAKSAGARTAGIVGRDGWQRKLPGFKKSFVVMTKDL